MPESAGSGAGSGKHTIPLPRLKQFRVIAGLTQAQLAERVDAGVRTIAGYEGGDNARPRIARRIADVLEVSVADLAGMNDPKVEARPLAITMLEQRAGSAYLARTTADIARYAEETSEAGIRAILDSLLDERDAIKRLLGKDRPELRKVAWDDHTGFQTIVSELKKLRNGYVVRVLILLEEGEKKVTTPEGKADLARHKELVNAA